MFTGIVREIGRVEAVEDATAGGVMLRLRAPETAAVTRRGDSVAVDGVCLTATAVEDGTIAFDAVPETLARSTLGALGAGAEANLEPALRAGEPLGGHIVQGHVDGIATVGSIEAAGDGARLELQLAADLARYCVVKGSITVQGVSLTIASVAGDTIRIALVPHTLAATTLGSLVPGDRVNVEIDVLAKYVERLLAERESR